jgi:hypothetical protein
MKRQSIRFGSKCRDDVGEFYIYSIQIALVEDGSIETDIEIERIGDDGKRISYPAGVPYRESYNLPEDAELVNDWRVLEY